MGSGTKIFLSIMGLLLVVIFIYYATIPQQAQTPAVNPTVIPQAAEVEEIESKVEDQFEDSSTQIENNESPVVQELLARPEEEQPGAVEELSQTGQDLTNEEEPDDPVLTLDDDSTTDQPFRFVLSDAVRQALAEEAAADSSDHVNADAEPESDQVTSPQSPSEAGNEAVNQESTDPKDAPGNETDNEEATPEETPALPTANPSVTQPQPPPTTDYVIKEGDTMSTIALEWFGDANKWDLIAQANPLVDPKDLRVGQTIRLPAKDVERSPITKTATSEQVIYTVRGGDNLSRIAQAYYGSSEHWRVIYKANKVTIGISPDRLKVGMKLVIPPDPTPAKKKNKSD